MAPKASASFAVGEIFRDFRISILEVRRNGLHDFSISSVVGIYKDNIYRLIICHIWTMMSQCFHNSFIYIYVCKSNRVKKLLLVNPCCEDEQPEQHNIANPGFQVLSTVQTLNYSGKKKLQNSAKTWSLQWKNNEPKNMTSPVYIHDHSKYLCHLVMPLSSLVKKPSEK